MLYEQVEWPSLLGYSSVDCKAFEILTLRHSFSQYLFAQPSDGRL